MPRRILFTSQKGGVGKSTLARSAAVALAYAGRKVLLADFDVDQRTCMRWQAQRVARALTPAIELAAFSKEKKLGRVEFEYQDIVIDTRGQHDELSLDLAVSSDVVFLPSSFSLDDVSPTLRVVESLRNAGIPSTTNRAGSRATKTTLGCAGDGRGTTRVHRCRLPRGGAGYGRIGLTKSTRHIARGC